MRKVAVATAGYVTEQHAGRLPQDRNKLIGVAKGDEVGAGASPWREKIVGLNLGGGGKL